MTKHIHKYLRQTLGHKGYIIYKCILPNCSHFLAEKLVLGRQAICWRCDNSFIITKFHKKPHCESCVKGNRKEIDNKLLEQFAGILNLGDVK